MCLILFAINPNPRIRLVVAANRDELYERPAAPADFWPDAGAVLAGKDLTMGGTWLGVTRNNRFAAVTNFKEEPPQPIPPLSRGELPLRFLTGTQSAAAFCDEISDSGQLYRGFNLLTFDGDSFVYYGNRTRTPKVLGNGCYGLSNQLLDCDWPKVVEGRQKLTSLLEDPGRDVNTNALFSLLLDQGDGRDFSNSFIASDRYGTRAATVLVMYDDGRVVFEERTFLEGGVAGGVSNMEFISARL